MSVQVLTNCKLYVDGYDLSGRTSKLGLSLGAKAVDMTAFSHDTENFLPGLKTFKAAHEVLLEEGVGLINETLFNRIGSAGSVIMTVGPTTGAEGEPAYFGKVMGSRFTLGGRVGDGYRGSFDAEAQIEPCRGLVGVNRTSTTTSTGPVINAGAVAAGQTLYAALHVLTVQGTGTPTLTPKLRSAALVGFGSPSDRITFAGQTAIGAAWGAAVAGPITDAFWRVDFTISGTNPSFTWVLVFAIQ